MSFRHSALFMIRKRYLDLDLSDIDLTKMKGWDKPDPTNGSNQQKDQNTEGDAVADQVEEWEDLGEKM